MSKFLIALATAGIATAALAQDDAPPPPPPPADQGYYGVDRAPPPPDRTYYGQDGRYYQDCRRSSGTTGTLAGAGGGGLLAGLLGASPLGIAAGVVGGGLLGRHLDKQHDEAQNERNGC
jgi:hypothetical protein